MIKEKILRLLLLPLIFMVILYVPVLFFNIAPDTVNSVVDNMPTLIRILYTIILIFSMFVWCLLFYYIPLWIYIVLVLIYTSVSWVWLIKHKMKKKQYYIIWFCLATLSVFLYWRLGPLYRAMING